MQKKHQTNRCVLKELLRLLQREQQQTNEENERILPNNTSTTDRIRNEAARQNKEIVVWAKKKNVLIFEPIDYFDESIGEEHLEGTEAVVWAEADRCVVTKSITYNHHKNVKELLEKILAHNYMFQNAEMNVIGVGSSEKGVSIIVEQPLIEHEWDVPTLGEIETYMTNNLKFRILKKKGTHIEYIKNGIVVTDINQNNVVKVEDGSFVVIDCDAEIINHTIIESYLFDQNKFNLFNES